MQNITIALLISSHIITVAVINIIETNRNKLNWMLCNNPISLLFNTAPVTERVALTAQMYPLNPSLR